MEERDLFEHPEELPKAVQNLINGEHDVEFEDTYEACAKMLKIMNSLGYTFEYGLDAEPYDLRKLTQDDLIGKTVIIGTGDMVHELIAKTKEHKELANGIIILDPEVAKEFKVGFTGQVPPTVKDLKLTAMLPLKHIEQSGQEKRRETRKKDRKKRKRKS